MIRNLKVLGLALVAMLAMTAVVASAASASKFMSEGNVNTKITANQITGEDHVFSVEGNKVECETAKFETAGEIASPSETIKAHPTYSGCTAFGFVGSTVTTTGCDYNLKAGTKIEAGKYNGSLAVECESGKLITIVAGTCEATVGSQSLNGLTYTNSSPVATVNVGANVTGITTVKVKDGFLCPFAGTGTVNNATYTGNTKASGTSGGSPVNITVED